FMISLFTPDEELIEFGVTVIKYWFLFMPVVGFQIIGSSYFQAVGRPKTAMFLTLTRQVILLIPAIIIFPQFWQIRGIFYATPFADFTSFLLTAAWFAMGMKKVEDHMQKRFRDD
ncbi:MAG TPA: MATE family efflux transporter, partial [Eubacteriaceae bacterium]|nr:MATE family efflux transporter [Eubacteriaceae bacterium]